MDVNRAVEEDDNYNKVAAPVDIPVKRGTIWFDLSHPSLSTFSLLQRRRKVKDQFSKFSSLDELENDFFS